MEIYKVRKLLNVTKDWREIHRITMGEIIESCMEYIDLLESDKYKAGKEFQAIDCKIMSLEFEIKKLKLEAKPNLSHKTIQEIDSVIRNYFRN